MLGNRGNIWRERAVLVATVVAILLLASHPELRLLVPFVDAFGIDLFVLLVGSQAWSYARPRLVRVGRSVALPVARHVYASIIFLLGIAGPCVDTKLARWIGNGR